MADAKSKTPAKGAEAAASRQETKLHDTEPGNVPITKEVPEGTPPVLGEEGGVVKEGTGDYAPDAEAEAAKLPFKTLKVEDRDGAAVNVKVGVDGVSPISPDNPDPKAAIGGSDNRPVSNQEAKGRSEGTEGDRLAKDGKSAGEGGGKGTPGTDKQ